MLGGFVRGCPGGCVVSGGDALNFVNLLPIFAQLAVIALVLRRKRNSLHGTCPCGEHHRCCCHGVLPDKGLALGVQVYVAPSGAEVVAPQCDVR